MYVVIQSTLGVPLSHKIRRAVSLARSVATRSVLTGDTRLRQRPFILQRLAVEATRDDYEPELTRLLRTTLGSSGGAFVDVGTNVGQTLLRLLGIDPGRRYVGFEPQVEACAEVSRLISENALPHHEILPCALSDRNGIARLGLGYESDVRASIAFDYRPEDFFPTESAVLVRRGDDVLAELGVHSTAIIKIDVEGAELEVLRGLGNTIDRDGPLIMFEVLPDILLSTGDRLPDDVIETRRDRQVQVSRLLEELDYETFLLSSTDEVRHPIAPDPRGGNRNYLARRSR